MGTYYLTIYDKSGEKLLDENFEASHDEKAKEIAEQKLNEHQYLEYSYRCVASNGRLILFHS